MLIKTFQAAGKKFVYTAWTNGLAEISDALYRELTDKTLIADCDRSKSRSRPYRYAAEKTGVEVGILPTENLVPEALRPNEIASAIDKLEREGPEVLVLTVTEVCNLRCSYCIYSGAYHHARRHSKTTMSAKTASKAVDWYMSFDRNSRHIGFYGGEPLAAWDVVKVCVDYARARQASGDELSFGMTTNGVLLNDGVQDFLASNQFELFISVDGPKSIHDRYRVNAAGRKSFDKVWNKLLRFRERHPDYFRNNVNFTITVVPPDPLDEIEQFIEEYPDIFEGKIPTISMLSGDPSNVLQILGLDERAARIDTEAHWNRFIEDCVQGRVPSAFRRALCERAITELHCRPMDPIERYATSAGQCTPGSRCHVDPGGRLHMCEHIDHHFPIGDLDSGFSRPLITEYVRSFQASTESRCTDCWAARLCSKCIPQIAEGAELSERRFASLCDARRREIEARLVRFCEAKEINPACFDWIARPSDRNNPDGKGASHERPS